MTDPTLDPAMRSWIDVQEGSDFPVQNLPFGVFRTRGTSPRVGVAIGDHVIDMAVLAGSGALRNAEVPPEVFSMPTLNDYLGLGKQVWADVRSALSRLLAAPAPPEELTPGDFVVAMDKVDLLLPIAIGDYVDFYSSVEHATNVGKLFRPGEPPLPPNWRHLPIGYHGRASSVVVCGTPIHRPRGQRRPPGGDVGFGPSTRLDFELEIGFITGGGNVQGSPITAAAAEQSIFGMCLVNDWSARDIQAWEYRPLGPFLSKSFATSMSPWIVQLEALAGHRVPAPAQDPAPLPYLTSEPNLGVDLDLEIELNDTIISETNFRHMYWTMAQQLAPRP